MKNSATMSIWSKSHSSIKMYLNSIQKKSWTWFGLRDYLIILPISYL